VPTEDEAWARATALSADRGIRARIILANGGGALLVALQLVVIGNPSSLHGAQLRRYGLVSGTGALVFLVVAVVTEDLRSRRRRDRAFGWLAQRRPPNDAEARAALNYPLDQAGQILIWWCVAGIALAILTGVLSHDVAYSARAGLSLVLGGLTCAALSTLMLEQYNRPVFVVVLASATPGQQGGQGLRTRLLLIWALSAAVPVAAIVTAPAGLSASQRASMGIPLALLGVLALIAGLVLTLVASQSIVEPLDALRASQLRVESGDLTVDVPVDDSGEVGLLQSGFNRMVAGLRERQRIQELFGRHVGVEVAREALRGQAQLGGERRSATALFVDVAGSTSLAQRLPPEEVVALLNQFFAAVVGVVAAEQGWVNKFEGDAALCVFGPPGNDEHHATHGLRAARALREELTNLRAVHDGFDAGIGLSSGTVVAGNVGAEDRYEYTVIGDPVNEAARLADLAKKDPTRTVASGNAIDAAGSEAAYWRRKGSELLRGRDTPTDIYIPIKDEG
jgi:adenylate cyclase